MATNNHRHENDGIETLQTWNKFSSSAKKAGYRDGATDGRNTVYQKSFDDGYIQGFKNGFALGKCKGSLSINSEPVKDSDLEHTRRGSCQICANEKLLQGTIKEIIDIQTQFSNSVLEKLHSKYSPRVNVTLKQN